MYILYTQVFTYMVYIYDPLDCCQLASIGEDRQPVEPVGQMNCGGCCYCCFFLFTLLLLLLLLWCVKGQRSTLCI